MIKIKFGTDGWRGIIGKEFTLNNVKVVSQSIADYIKAHGLRNKGVVVGYDTRKLSRQFADGVCEVMLGNGIPTYVTERDVPTPVAAFEVFYRKAGGAVMITASHNPPEWNGIKYIPEYAGPALPETTEEITKNISIVLQARKINETSIESGVRTRLLKTVDLTTSYMEFVRKQMLIRDRRKLELRKDFFHKYFKQTKVYLVNTTGTPQEIQ